MRYFGLNRRKVKPMLRNSISIFFQVWCVQYLIVAFVYLGCCTRLPLLTPILILTTFYNVCVYSSVLLEIFLLPHSLFFYYAWGINCWMLDFQLHHFKNLQSCSLLAYEASYLELFQASQQCQSFGMNLGW